MSIISHVHLPPANDTAFEERILLNVSSSNCQIVAMNVITPSFPAATDLEWLGIADLKTTHQGAIYCEAAPQCSIELHSALLTGYPLTESGVIINSGENFYVEYNYTALEICDGWILQADMKVRCNDSTSTDYSFCRFMFGTECADRLAQDMSPSISPVASSTSVPVVPSLSSLPSVGSTIGVSGSAGPSVTVSSAPELVIPPDGPIIPGVGGAIFNQHFPQINGQINNRRVV